MLIRSRRDFFRDTLRSIAAVGAAGAMSKFGEMNALAAGANYQALVCIFLAGGNDGHNMVVPVTTAGAELQPLSGADASPWRCPKLHCCRFTMATTCTACIPRCLRFKRYTIRARQRCSRMSACWSPRSTATPIRTAHPSQARCSPIRTRAANGRAPSPSGIASTGWGGRMTIRCRRRTRARFFRPSHRRRAAAYFAPASRRFPAVVPPAGTLDAERLGRQCIPVCRPCSSC